MRFLDRVDISGSMNLGSVAKDQFIIGTPNLENNSGSVDELAVWANADFKNNVIIGSSPNDKLVISATISGNIGNVTASNLYLENGTIYLNGEDLLANMGGGGGGGGNNNGGGGGGGGNNQNMNVYGSMYISSSTDIPSGTTADIYFINTDQVSSSITINLPDIMSQSIMNRKFIFKNISTSYVLVGPENSQYPQSQYSASLVPSGSQTIFQSTLTGKNYSSNAGIVNAQTLELYAGIEPTAGQACWIIIYNT
jgi:hypothetical protein